MVDILVKPPLLTATASDIRSHANKLQAAIDAVDADIRALGPGSFEGHRADTLRANYSKVRENIYSFKKLLDQFAKDLDQVAIQMTAADAASKS